MVYGSLSAKGARYVKIDGHIKAFEIARGRHRINLSGEGKSSLTWPAIRDISLADVAQPNIFSYMIYEQVPGKLRSEECIRVMVRASRLPA